MTISLFHVVAVVQRAGTKSSMKTKENQGSVFPSFILLHVLGTCQLRKWLIGLAPPSVFFSLRFFPFPPSTAASATPALCGLGNCMEIE